MPEDTKVIENKAGSVGAETPAATQTQTDETPKTSAELEAYTKKLKEEAAGRRLALKASEDEKAKLAEELEGLRKEKAERERKEAEARGEWQKLAETEKTRAAELEAKLKTTSELAGKYEARLKAEAEALAGKLPESTRKALNLEGMPIETRVETLRIMVDLAGANAQTAAEKPNVASPPNPKVAPATDGKTREKSVAEIKNNPRLTWAQKAQALKKLDT